MELQERLRLHDEKTFQTDRECQLIKTKIEKLIIDQDDVTKDRNLLRIWLSDVAKQEVGVRKLFPNRKSVGVVSAAVRSLMALIREEFHEGIAKISALNESATKIRENIRELKDGIAEKQKLLKDDFERLVQYAYQQRVAEDAEKHQASRAELLLKLEQETRIKIQVFEAEFAHQQEVNAPYVCGELAAHYQERLAELKENRLINPPLGLITAALGLPAVAKAAIPAEILTSQQPALVLSSPEPVDLHGYTVKEADVKVRKEIVIWRQTQQPYLDIITGKGNHSHGGIPKIKNKVKAICQEQELNCEELPNNSGRLHITLPCKSKEQPSRNL